VGGGEDDAGAEGDAEAPGAGEDEVPEPPGSAAGGVDADGEAPWPLCPLLLADGEADDAEADGDAEAGAEALAEAAEADGDALAETAGRWVAWPCAGAVAASGEEAPSSGAPERPVSTSAEAPHAMSATAAAPAPASATGRAVSRRLRCAAGSLGPAGPVGPAGGTDPASAGGTGGGAGNARCAGTVPAKASVDSSGRSPDTPSGIPGAAACGPPPFSGYAPAAPVPRSARGGHSSRT
jgi:hypothetical protein